MSFNPNEHMMKLKGKDYLQVMWRLVWFREEHPDWTIDTVLCEHEGESAVFRAAISDDTGRLISTGYGSESKKDFGDYLEKAETKAVGRALAMLGYGTQFTATVLDEGSRIVDSPVDRGRTDAIICESCGLPIKPAKKKDGTVLLADDIAEQSLAQFGKKLCVSCAKKAKNDQ